MSKKKLTVKLPRKFIITVGEDGGILVYMEGKRVLRRMFASSPEPADLKHFESLLDNDQKASIALLVDTTDQTYVQQTLPPVSPLGISKLIERRLERDFGGDDIKGAIKIERSSEGRKEWHYLFIAVANNPLLAKWIDFILDRPNPCQGIFMLPVESEWLVNRLNRQAAPKVKKPLITLTRTSAKKTAVAVRPKWVVLVSHNKVGGFRQVVTRNGKVIFTRLSQPIGEPAPAVIAGNIEQEISNTIEYLKRLSYVQNDPLDIMVVVANEIRHHLTLESTENRQVAVYTPHEVAAELGLINATEEGDHFGDVVFASSFGLNRTPIKRFSVPELDRIMQLQTIRTAVDAFTKIAVPLVIAMMIFYGFGIMSSINKLSFTASKSAEAKNRIAELESNKKQLPPDIDKMIDSAEVDLVMAKTKSSPLPMIADFSKILDDKTLVRNFDWVASTPYPGSRRVVDLKNLGQEGQPPLVEAGFTVEFIDNSGDIDEFLKRADKFFSSVKNAFGSYNVVFSDIPGVTKQSQAVEVNFGQDKVPVNQLPSKDIAIKYTISGPFALGSGGKK